MRDLGVKPRGEHSSDWQKVHGNVEATKSDLIDRQCFFFFVNLDVR